MAKQVKAFEADDGSLHRTAKDAERHDTHQALVDAVSGHADEGYVSTLVSILERDFEIKLRRKAPQ